MTALPKSPAVAAMEAPGLGPLNLFISILGFYSLTYHHSMGYTVIGRWKQK